MLRIKPYAISNLGDDAGAVEGLPLKLIIVMVILAITIPLIIGSFRAYDAGRVETSLLSEISAAASAVQTVYASGPGNSMTIDFNPASGAMTNIESVTFGDIIGGSTASAIRYKIQGRAECIVAVTSPNVPMSGANGTPLSICSGNHLIRAECLDSGRDLNGDGLGSDTYVCLSVIS